MTLEEIEKWSNPQSIEWLLERVKQLEDGIRKHRDLRKGWNIRFWKEDEDLYKLLEET